MGQQYTKEYFNGVTVFACPFCGNRFYCNEEECEVIREALEMRDYAWEANKSKPILKSKCQKRGLSPSLSFNLPRWNKKRPRTEVRGLSYLNSGEFLMGLKD